MRPADEAAARGDWAEYFRLARVGQGARVEVPRPAPEVVSTDPWPEDFVAPPVVAKLRMLAESVGWEARMGYSRVYVSKGQGKVWSHGGVARWVLHHVVQLAVRRPGGQGLSDGWIMYCQAVGGKGWQHMGSMIGREDANVGQWRAFVESLEVES